MEYAYSFTKKAIISRLFAILLTVSILLPGANVQAATGNLIKNPSFEQGSVTTYWDMWNVNPNDRTYSMFRSYEVPFGGGSYSAAIEATGSVNGLYDAGIGTKTGVNPIAVTAGKTYFFSLYTKASQPTDISVYLQRADNYQSLGPAQQISIGTNWERKYVVLQSNTTTNAIFGMAFGDLPQGTTLYLDTLDLSENNLNVATKDVAGFIGQAKTISITGNNNLTVDDIQIELPYFNPNNNTVERKKFTPTLVRNGTATFTIPVNTYSGLGKVYFINDAIGDFNYNVLAKVTEVSPEPVRPDEDLVVYGSGFNPDLSKNFVLVKGTAVNGVLFDSWIAPHTVDSDLSQLVVKLPVGLANSKLHVRTYFTNMAGTSVENKSNLINYTIKPVIYGATWSERGREQVGDKLTINGKGIAYKPVVQFYNEADQLISQKAAVVKKIVTGTTNYEEIEVITPVSLNKVKITAKVGANESEKADALIYTAKPTITSIRTAHKRIVVNNTIIPAAKTGETIRLFGQGFKTTAPASIAFWSIRGGVLTQTINPASIDPNGTWVDVTVPAGIQNGQVNLEINGQKSNNMSFELIPTIISSQPIEPVPGGQLTITAQGIALDPSKVIIYFKSPNNPDIEVKPSALTEVNNNVEISVTAPNAIPNKGSSLKIQSDHWLNDETYRVIAAPHIEDATINTDTDVLSIKGYGFSPNLNNNKITFKYADGTVVTPRIKMLGVYSTPEGQEIKVSMLDGYYYGYLYLTVDGDRSNEVNVGPAVITRLERRVQFVQAANRVMGVVYISGRNFGTHGDVKVGNVWATTHYRSNTFIIAVLERGDLYKNPVIVTK